MKTTIEVNGYEIVIEEIEGSLTVSALKDGETVEEFTLGSSEEESDDIQGFDEFSDESEEEDFEDESEEGFEDEESDESEEDESEEDFEDEESEEESEEKMESFSSFFKKKK
jgi:Mg-chelatase subunit ChlI